MRTIRLCARGWIVMAMAPMMMSGERGAEAWLRYEALEEKQARAYRQWMPATIVTAGSGSLVVTTARNELLRGVQGMLGRTLRVEPAMPREESAIVLGYGGGVGARAAGATFGDGG
jgi:alpha-glucuronidase